MGEEQQRKDRPDAARIRDGRPGSAAAANRINQQHTWVDLQVQQAMARGDFDDLPGAGKPIEDLGPRHDPDWWLKKLIEREQVTGVLPPSLQLRKDDAELDGRLDALASEREVREALEEFNARVMRARYTPVDGPPLVTQPRDADAEVAAWRERRTARRTATRPADHTAAQTGPQQRRWWRPSSYRRP